MGRFGVRVGAVVAAMATALGVLAAAATPPAGAVGVTPSTTTLSAMTSPFACDQRVTATVTVSVAPAPTGSVQFLDGATPVGTPVNLQNTAALSKSVTSSLLGLGPGTHTISAVYSGDTTYASSGATPQTVTFAPYLSTIAPFAATPSSARTGVAVSFPATVGVDSHCVRRPTGSTHPTGTVTYADGSTGIGTGTLVNGNATFTTGALAVGQHNVTASYTGDANFSAPPSALTQVNITSGGGKLWQAQTVTSSAQGTASLVFANVPRIFFYDPAAHTLNQAWWTGTAWTSQVLDGGAGGLNGRVTDDVGQSPSAALYNGMPNIFYYDKTLGDLRHAAWDGHAWQFESLDGFTGPRGRTNGDVGLESTVIIDNGLPQLFYRQIVDPTHSRLRHAWLTSTGWSFAQVDVGANSGRANTALVYKGLVHVFTYTGSNLRHGWYSAGAWHFENLDGTQVGPHGQVNNNVGAYAQAALVNGLPNVWYQQAGAPAKLRHGSWTGSFWSFETIDGAANNLATGAVGADVGYDITVLVVGTTPHVWYRDATNQSLRHAFLSGSTWRFDIDDGFAGTAGQQPGLGVDTVATASVVFFNNTPMVFYSDAVTHQMRRAFYA